ncbi:MAG: beta-galactosidase trimerization domain-containing protein [Candidatus Hydrogenedentes bacterium]|nr:beta-galactosidase trimerization domain-containing protein [Candidatus Hydrogenedentota bacterium]
MRSFIVPVCLFAMVLSFGAWAQDGTLPKVLLIGDSISMGYTEAVQRKLGHEAVVERIPGNGQSTDCGLKNIDAWLRDDKWDVIHFNWGIWDTHIVDGKAIRNKPEVYAANLRDLVQRLRCSGAALVWASTTPVAFDVYVDGLGVEKKSVPIYNDIASQVMKEFQIPVDDLYGYALPRLIKLQTHDGVHFTDAGSEALADSVATSIRQALAARKKAPAAAETSPPTPRLMRNVLLWPDGPLADFDKIKKLDIITLHSFPRIAPKPDGLKPIDLTNEWIEKQWAGDVRKIHEQGIQVWSSVSSTGFYPSMFKEHGLDPEHYYARDAEGKPQMMLGGSYGTDVMSSCYNNPEWMALLEANTLAYAKADFDGIWFDVGGYADAALLYCHCQFCTDDWKQASHDAGLPEGTPLPTLESSRDYTQAVNRVHLRWRYDIWEKEFRKIRDAAKAINPEFVYLHNSSAMPDGIPSVGVYFTAITKLYDAAHWEEWGHGAAPYSLLPSYFLGKMAAGERPVLLVQNDKPARTEVQHRIALAEAYAAGGVLQNQNIPEANTHFYKFLKQHEDLFVGNQSLATVGVVTSICSKDFYENGASVKPAYWMGWLLQDLHVPYDYLLAERDMTPEILQKYKVIVLPDLALMSDEQVAVIKQYIEQGGRVLATHNTAKYDADMNDKGRARLSEFAGKSVDASTRAEIGNGRFAYDSGYPERDYTSANPRDLAISEKLNPPGAPPAEIKAALDWITEDSLPIKVNAKTTTAVIPQHQASRLLIHVINYYTYPDGKQITRDENVQVTVNIPAGHVVKAARAVTPDTPSFTADFALANRDGSVQITLPSLETYTLIDLELSPAP